MLLLAALACAPEEPATPTDSADTAVDTAADTAGDTACDALAWYADADGDGFGDAATERLACEAPADHVSDATDCDDADAAAFPGAAESCDGRDDDCDGETDEPDALDAGTWYADADQDGFGEENAATVACDAPDGHAAWAGDCNDTSADVSPAGIESCDGLDEDCDGEVDEDEAVDAPTWYADTDGDGYGDATVSTAACDQPSAYVSDATDCNDTSADVSPAATETCDDVDQDCDGDVDDDAIDTATWYADTDGDGYGDADVSVEACDAPAAYVSDATDCNDTSADVSPAATETCDDVDQDCDGDVDEDAIDPATWYADTDGDGYGDADVSVEACDAPAGYLADATDCNDTSADVSPAATETCDDVDQDCDGDVDEDAIDPGTWYADTDGDGYGDADVSVEACDAPAGYLADASDCNDTSADVSPAATETCDDVDQDCDGAIDDGAIDPATWYADADGDGYGDATVSTAACDQPAAYVSDATDCDDGDTSVTDAVGHPDADGDGYGDAASPLACGLLSGLLADGSDCDDARAHVYPGATEVCDGVQDDCDTTGWTTADEAGLATFEDAAGGWTDETATLAAGTSTTPVEWTWPDDGTLHVCAGDWYLTLDAGSAATIGLDGPNGAADTRLASTTRVLTSSSAADVSMSGVSFTGGASGDGGASYLSGGDVTVTDAWFEGLIAINGGALYVSDATLTITDSTFTDNEAYVGGALYLLRTTAELDGVTISDHHASSLHSAAGGAFLAASTVTFTDSEITDNSAYSVGAVYASASTVTFVDTLVADNWANYWGAVAYGTVVCRATAAGTYGFLRNASSVSGAAVAVASLVSEGCDWGTGADDNSPSDVTPSPYFYGDDATFECDATSCW